MTYSISKTFKFEAAHQLIGLPADHQCARLHGHSYSVEVSITSNEIGREGWILDFGELKSVKQHIDEVFDHRFLNDIFGDVPTTSECLAEYFFNWCKGNLILPVNVSLESITVSETEKTSATYYE